MRSGKAPSHIPLPPKPTLHDVFSSSALVSDPTASSDIMTSDEITSPTDSPIRSTSQDHSGDGTDVDGRRKSRSYSYRVGKGRNSIASGSGRRMSRNSWTDSMGGTRRALFSPSYGHDRTENEGDEVKPAIPSLAVGIRPAYSTPLPLLPMMVLCIAMLSEFLSANTPTPFLLKMVEDFIVPSDPTSNTNTESSVGLWTGNLVSVFFITQFFTSLLWSSVADKYGRRAVLVVSMLGSALTVVTFGTSQSLPEAICIRLGQGIFSGAIGVFRGSIRDITDPTNEARAYALLGFSWGMGGVIGPILGGVFESPAKNYPNSAIGQLPLFISLPYLLPCLLAGSILLIGAILALGLSWDGGPRRTRIALPIEKDNVADQAGATSIRDSSPVPSGIAASAKRKASSIFAGVADAGQGVGQVLTMQQARIASMRDQEELERGRRASRSSMGTAYGYGGIRSKRESMAAQALAARRPSSATIRAGPGAEGGEEVEEDESSHLNFAQKLLLANEENTFSINDLWVSAAIAQETAVFDEDDEETEDDNEEDEELQENESREYTDSVSRETPSHSGRRSSRMSPSVHEERSPLQDHLSVPPPSGSRARLAGVDGSFSATPTSSGHRTLSTARLSGNYGPRRFSTASHSGMPAIFANTGLQTPPAIASAYEQEPLYSGASSPGGHGLSVPPVTEHTVLSPGGLSAIQEQIPTLAKLGDTPNIKQEEKPHPTGWRTLPMLIILQYGLLALHDTVHGQIFLSFLVSTYKTGGMGLFPSSFSLLIALMCLFQLYYQFYLYPHLGPPRGRLNHLQMFRLGSMLFIPAYLTLPLLRIFTSEGKHGGGFVMFLLTVNMACRYCGGVFAYTSVMVLINAMSPPPVVGLANGLAQSLVSLGRFVGPVIGGGLWSAAIKGNPDGYFFPFYAVAGMCGAQVLLSYLIR